MKKKNTALAGALLLVLAGWSAADAAEIYTLDPIIVTAERTNTKELTLKKSELSEELITKDFVERFNGQLKKLGSKCVFNVLLVIG